MTRIHQALSIIVAVGAIVVLTSLAAAQDDEGWSSETPEAAAPAVEITMSDFKIDPSTLTLAAGPASFALRNQGVIDHNFAIENAQRQVVANSSVLSAGQSSTFDVTLAPGTYTMVCTLPAHREAGMVGTLTVTQ